MIIGTGLDMVKVKDLPFKYIQETFTKQEQTYCDSDALLGLPRWEKYAAIIAAKEAFKKALGFAFLNIPMLDMEVLRDKNGRPSIVLCCPEKYGHQHMHTIRIHTTLTHIDKRALAMVVIEETITKQQHTTWYNYLLSKIRKER